MCVEEQKKELKRKIKFGEKRNLFEEKKDLGYRWEYNRNMFFFVNFFHVVVQGFFHNIEILKQLHLPVENTLTLLYTEIKHI